MSEQQLVQLSKQDLSIINEFYTIEKQIKELKAKQDVLRPDLVDIMEDYNIKSWENELFKATYVGESTTEIFDSAKFKEENPEVAKHYMKESKRKASVRVTLK